jgi:hypothetical protein
MEDTPHSILLWCNEQDEKVKSLQDVCLDRPLDQEAKEILTRLSQLQEEIELLSKDCYNELFT